MLLLTQLDFSHSQLLPKHTQQKETKIPLKIRGVPEKLQMKAERGIKKKKTNRAAHHGMECLKMTGFDSKLTAPGLTSRYLMPQSMESSVPRMGWKGP